MKGLIYIIVFLMGEFIFATTVSTTLKEQNEISKSVLLPKNVTIRTSVSLSGTVTDESESEGSRTATLSLRPTYRINSDYSVSASAAVTQEYEIEKVIYSNTTLSLNLPQVKLFNDSVTLYSNVSGALPTNYIAYRDESFRGNLSLGTTASARLFNTVMPIDVTYGLSGGRNFHKFRRNNFRRSNTEYFLSHSLGVSKTWSPVTVSLNGSLNPAWDYSKEYEPTYSLSQSIIYTSQVGVTYSLSHSTSDRALDYRGDFSNVRLLDSYRSRINFNLAYTIK